MSCGKGFSLFVKFCVWICQWERCPTAQPHACAPWMSQQFLSGLRAWWSALNGTGLLLRVLVWLRQDQMKGSEERLSGYDTPAKGAALRLSTVFSKGILYNVWGLWFFEKNDTYERKKERGKDIFHRWWSILSDRVWKSFYICYVKSYLYAETWERVVTTPPSSGRAMGATRKPRLHEWRLMEQSTWVQAMSIILP